MSKQAEQHEIPAEAPTDAEDKEQELGTKTTWTDPKDGEVYDAYEMMLPYKGQDVRWVVREITLGEEGEYMASVADVVLTGDHMRSQLNLKKITTETVYLSLCEGPFDCTPGEQKRELVAKLRGHVGNALGHYADLLNNFSDLKKAASNTPSSTAAPTDE